MKKISQFILMFLILCSSAVFIACGDKYGNLNVSFSIDGQKVNEVVLTIGDKNLQSVGSLLEISDTVNLEISLNNIDKSDVGQISVYSSPMDLVSVTNYRYEGNKCTVTVKANRGAENGAKLIVSHLSSNKTFSIDLNIQQKSNDIQLKSSDYVVSIPAEGESEHIIDTKKLLTLLYNGNTGCTDDVYYTALEGSLPAGVTAINNDFGGMCGFKLLSTTTNATLKVYPVTYLEGFDTTQYTDKVITIHFVKTLTEGDINLSVVEREEDGDGNIVDERYDIYDISKTISLIKNDEKLNSLKISLGELLKSETYTKYYDLKLESDNDSIMVTTIEENGETYIYVRSALYTDKIVNVTISLVPKYVGDIETVSRVIKFDNKMKADIISITKGENDLLPEYKEINNVTNIEYNTDIFDYYQNSSYGEVFKFSAKTYSGIAVLDELSKVKISIDYRLLRINSDSGTALGLGNVYNDESFNTQINKTEFSSTDGNKYTIGCSKSLLDFRYSNGSCVKFYLDTANKVLISEEITKDIYLKYVDNSSGTETVSLAFNVLTTNNVAKDSSYTYLLDATPTEVTINFNQQDGISEMNVYAGYYYTGEGKGVHADIGNESGEEGATGTKIGEDGIFLDRVNDQKLTIEGVETEVKCFVHLAPSSLIGLDGKMVSNANLIVSIISNGQTTPLKISSDNNGSSNPMSNLDIKMSNNNLYIYFVFDKNTSLGEYIIRFEQVGTLFRKDIPISVYESFGKNEDLKVQFETGEKLFEHDVKYGDEYRLADNIVASNYIVASNQKVVIDTILPEELIDSVSILDGYTYSASIIDKDENELEGKEISEYFTYIHDGAKYSNAELNFIKGTYIKDKHYFIKLTVKVEYVTYKDIITKNDKLESKEISIGFYIYDEISNSDVSISGDRSTVYAVDALGIYNQNTSRSTITLSMEEALWDYTQGGIAWNYATDDVSELGSTNNSITLLFDLSQGGGGYTKVINAEIKQFNKTITKSFIVTVKVPIISEEVRVTSPLYRDEDGYYINMKANSSYELMLNNYSQDGYVTHPGFEVMVVDNSGNIVSNVFTINKNAIDKYTVNVKDVVAGNYTLLVFAQDALRQVVGSNYGGYNNPSNFIIDGPSNDTTKYKNAYQKITIKLSDGTKNNPYLIHTAEELLEISDTYFYRLERNIDMSNINKGISEFNGILLGNNKTISGLTLDNNRPNLFTNFSGEMSEVHFSVNYNYDGTLSSLNLGIIGTNTGNLTDVSVEVSGSVTINNTDDTYSIYFGGLVGINEGNIYYTDDSIVGGDISITLEGTNKVIFGGLVGKNIGTIDGRYQSQNGAVIQTLSTSDEQTISIGSEGALASVNITSTLSNDSAIGGVAGENSGNIQNAYVTGIINATNTNNVGGLIGKNIFEDALSVTVTYKGNVIGATTVDADDAYNVRSITSNVKINAQNYVGGIVGYNENGAFIDCHYQIVASINELDKSTKSTALKGNENVGGIAGYTYNGVFDYCSVYSYWWNYFDLDNTFANCTPDITATTNVGGLVGNSKSDNTNDIASGDKISALSISYSSVNAYISVAKNGIIAGIANNNEGIPVMHNAYFLGDMIRNGESSLELYQEAMTNFGTKSHLYLAGKSGFAIYFNMEVEGINTSDNSTIYAPNENFELWSNWEYNKDRNGKYIYITQDGNVLFEEAPTDIESIVKDDVVVPKPIEKENYTDYIVLNYYNFNSSDISNAKLIELTKKYNTYTISSLINWEVDTKSLTETRLYITSSDSNVVSISNNGTQLIVRGLGECELTFMSVLNPSVRDTIIVRVVSPLGKYVITDNPDHTENLTNLTIAKGKSKLLYYVANGVLTDSEGKEYKYVTENNPYFLVKITSTVAIAKYLKISGIDLTNYTKEDGSVELVVDSTKPFSIDALKNIEDIEDIVFTISITPYIVVEHNGESIDIDYNILNTYNEQEEKILPTKYTNAAVEIYLKIKEGATDISMANSGAILYPSDSSIITVYVTTDMPITAGDLTHNIISDNIDENLDISKYYSLEVIEIRGLEDGKQTIKYRLTINTTPKEATALNITIGLEGKNISAMAEYTVLPQRIEDIEIKNYVYDTNGNIVSSDMIKPATETNPNGSLIIIDMVPKNAYFNYLEIRDITSGNETIKFIHVIGTTKEPVEKRYSTDDGLGIKIDKDENDDGKYYIYAQIESSYTTKVHTLEVSAYLTGVSAPIYTETMNIHAKMLPSIDVSYNLPNGNSLKSSTEKADTEMSYYLASGTDAELNIKVNNATTGLMYNLSTDNKNGKLFYEFIHDQGDFYKLRFIGTSDEWNRYLGQTITLTLTAQAVENNGEYEETSITLKFTLVEYVIHSISVSPSIDGEIYGHFNTWTALEFYLAPNDISYFKRASKNSEYHYDDSYSGDTLESIYTILESLNPRDDNSNTIKNYVSYSEAIEISMKDTDIDSIKQLSLKVDKDKYTGNEELSLTLPLKLDEDDNRWSIYTTGEPTTNLKQTYTFNFTDASSEREPIIVSSEKEFLAMSSGKKNYYVLGNDITLNEYIPMNLEVAQFDGNGHVITIAKFGTFDTAEVSAGLFKQVYKDMIVKNLTVRYTNIGEFRNDSVTRYFDFCKGEDVNYTSVSFGGIATINNGVITNCHVTGSKDYNNPIALRASTLENRGECMIIGGLVATNSSTGYITNSTSSLRIYSQSNIGGFVYKNEGKISSCANINGKIYAYNPNLGTTVEVHQAGFVVNNTGEIYMSYVSLDNENVMRSKDISAGFVLTNTGLISDSYVNIAEINYKTNSNYFSGFADSNSGSIVNAYSYINAGIRNDTNLHMFIRSDKNTGTLTDCIEIVNTSNYTNNIIGLEFTNLANSKNKFYNMNYAFGDTTDKVASATWTYVGNLPTLVSTLEKVEYLGNKTSDGEYFYGLITYRKVITSTDTGTMTTYVEYETTYGSKSNPYIIHDIVSWNEYFILGNMNSYFRIVRDIDFKTEGDNPLTSKMTFGGNIQGNSMTLSNILLRTEEELASIGLFSRIEKTDNNLTPAIRNLTLSASSVWASKTEAVGLLAGVIDSSNIYNITIDSAGLTLVGGNVVGGLAGIVRGDFDIQRIYSNVGANATRQSSIYQYHIYSSYNNKKKASNLSNVYYAGSVVGILDGYDIYDDSYSISNSRTVKKTENQVSNYYMVRDIYVDGNIVLLGDSVGGAFGLVGERVYVEKVNINIGSGSIAGTQYSGALAGENRGVIIDSSVNVIGETVFNASTYVSSGLVGINLGGLISDVNVYANIINTNSSTTVGGIVGRNINGTIHNATFSGSVSGYFVGGIVGADYSDDIVLAHLSGAGAIASSGRDSYTIPSEYVEYTLDDKKLTKYSNLKLSKSTVQYLISNLKNYYNYISNTDYDKSLNAKKVLGLCIGLSSYDSREISSYGYKDDYLVFNGELSPNNSGRISVIVDNGSLYTVTIATDGAMYTPYGNIITGIVEDTQVFVMQVIGARVDSFDQWNRTYASEKIILANDSTSVNDYFVSTVTYILSDTEVLIDPTKDILLDIRDSTSLFNGEWKKDNVVSVETQIAISNDTSFTLTGRDEDGNDLEIKYDITIEGNKVTTVITKSTTQS